MTVNREALTVKGVPAGDTLLGGGAGENAMLSRRVVGQGGARSLKGSLARAAGAGLRGHRSGERGGVVRAARTVSVEAVFLDGARNLIIAKGAGDVARR